MLNQVWQNATLILRLMDYTVTQESFDSLASFWSDPRHRLRWSSPFVLPAWLKVWWQELGTEAEPYLGVIRQGETGYVVTDNTPHQLADKIALLLLRPSPDTEATFSIRASVSRFSWSNIAEAIIRECQMVLANYLAPVP